MKMFESVKYKKSGPERRGSRFGHLFASGDKTISPSSYGLENLPNVNQPAPITRAGKKRPIKRKSFSA